MGQAGIRGCVLGAVLVAAVPVAVGQERSPLLELGVKQVREGSWTAAVIALDGAIHDLAPQVETRRAELVAAWVHKGWALVELQQIESARVCFRAALQQDPDLRLSADVYPGPVLDVFDSVRPSGAPSDRGNGWDPVKIGITAGLLGLGAAIGVKAANPPPDPSPFFDFYGGYVVRFAFRDPQACTGVLLPGLTTIVLSGNLDGSNFTVGFQPSLVVAVGVPSVASAPGTMERSGAFTASAPAAEVSLIGYPQRPGTNTPRRLTGTMTARGCAYTFQ